MVRRLKSIVPDLKWCKFLLSFDFLSMILGGGNGIFFDTASLHAGASQDPDQLKFFPELPIVTCDGNTV